MPYEKPPLDDFLQHYGVDHLKSNPGSGRYEWGSGDNPNQHSGTFLSRVETLRKANLPFYDNRKEIEKDGKMVPNPDYGKTFTGQTAIAKYLGMSTTEYRQRLTYEKNLEKMGNILRAEALWNTYDENGKHKYGYSEIARKMGLPSESSVRSLLEPSRKVNIEIARNTAEFIKERLEEFAKDDPKAMIDIGPGVEKELGITRTKLDNAVYILEQDGYKTHGGRVPNVTDPSGARQTTFNVIGMPDTTDKDFYTYEHIKSLKDYQTQDDGKTYKKKWEFPESFDSKRLMIRYAEDGGKDKDGLIELRRGVEDISLGEKAYAQVRILVDGDRYIKGMAAYGTDQKEFPPGIDIIFNTNKHKDVAMRDVLKEAKIDKATGEVDRENPFGSLIKEIDKGGQSKYIGEDGKEHLRVINKSRDEGDWEEWKKTLSAQFLSKQTVQLAKRQLTLAIQEKQQELEDILNLTNNTVKKYYLDSFASDCDSAAVHLTAAKLPRQKFQVIMPVPSLKDNEVYAPNFNNGEQVALIRYPHGGQFEIPILTVNNKHKDSIALIGTSSTDAICINSKVAEKLSGADFDGDTVMVIPTNDKIRIRNNNGRSLRGLEGFDPKDQYGCDPSKTYEDAEGNKHYFNKHGVEFKVMNNTQNEMGRISNLISDMQIIGAKDEELARAVRHSMVVIDAEKHKLDYRASYAENNIEGLKRKYQLHLNEYGEEVMGAATLISKAKSQKDVVKRKGQPRINIKGRPDYDPDRPEGALLYKEDPKAYYTVTKENKKTGEITTVEKVRMQPSTKMAETDDARTLISEYNTPMEQVYAAYANAMKALANTARKLSYDTKGIQYNPKAAKMYEEEVKAMENELDLATKNKPRERIAQVLATSRVNAKKQSNPELLEKKNKKELKKIKQREITKARAEVGAERYLITITDNMWEAIQAGAVHSNFLEKLLNHTDAEKLREKATPSSRKVMTDAMKQRAKAMKANGKTAAQIAASLGVSTSTIYKYFGSDD